LNSSEPSAPARVPVWDRLVRALHWTLASLLLAAWLTGESTSGWHEWLGYAAAALVATRLAWGVAAPRRHARFASFMRGPRATATYARAVLAGHAPRYLGHNPLGGWMVLALLACVALLALSGWLQTTEWLWGYAWLYWTHYVLGWLLVALVAAHLLGVLFTSWHQRENLVAAMFSGRKRRPEAGDVG
jgi:cytochrome b